MTPPPHPTPPAKRSLEKDIQKDKTGKINQIK